MNLLEIFKAVLIGFIQGITEWLPISSTGHMIIANDFIRLNVSESFMNIFLVVVQFGSVLSVVTLYFNRLNPFKLGGFKKNKHEILVIWFKIALSCVPAAIIGFLLDDFISKVFFNPFMVSFTLVLYGILFIVVEKYFAAYKISNLNKLNYKVALFIGLFQVLALIPGTSRSGATILGAVILGVSRDVAAEFSFFLSIPIMLGASFLKIIKYGFNFSTDELIILFVGIISAYLVSISAIKFLLRYIKKHSFKAFGVYRIVLGVLVAFYFLVNFKFFK
ncbi:MAG: undecaprenyl-diphosphate phosphatase [Oscillospiraceae bacterium]|jgi:undecaprenyl-diphosphatase|nr:undecaprenyl-diphosphate phosphatase [Oscillospiraceae bacterium]